LLLLHPINNLCLSRSERSYGIYQRNLQLPQDIDEDAIEADFRDGVVNIALPRVAKKAKGRQIELKTAGNQGERRLIDDNTNKVLENA
jgi:HSP20 family protein